MSGQTLSDILALVFGNISIIMSIAIEFPQLYKIVKTKNTSGTSLTTYLLFLFASFVWITWSVLFYLSSKVQPGVDMSALHLASMIPALLSNSVNVCLVSSIIFYKCKNLHICKKNNITELELSKRLFNDNMKEKWFIRYYPLFIVSFITLIVCGIEIIALLYTYEPWQASPEEFDKYQKVVMGVNITAAIVFETISWPQFIKCMKYKDTSGISIGWAIFLPLSCYVCLSYDIVLGFTTGFLNVCASIICSGSFINTAVLVLKLINMRKAKKLGMSEWTYTNKYLASKRKSK